MRITIPWTTGVEPGQIVTVREEPGQDGALWTFRVTEVREADRVMDLELDTEPTGPNSGLEVVLRWQLDVSAVGTVAQAQEKARQVMAQYPEVWPRPVDHGVDGTPLKVRGSGVGAAGSAEWWEGTGLLAHAVAGSRQADGREECYRCGKFVHLVTHSCKHVPVTTAARARFRQERENQLTPEAFEPRRPITHRCRFCEVEIFRHFSGAWVSAADHPEPCAERTEGHLPFMCHCGGPEEAVHGHPIGLGRYCRA